MNVRTLRRLEALEQMRPRYDGRWHRIILRGGEDGEAHMADMLASGGARDGDHFIRRVIVPAPFREGAL